MAVQVVGSLIDVDLLKPERVIDMGDHFGAGARLYRNDLTGESELHLPGDVVLLNPDTSVFMTLLARLGKLKRFHTFTVSGYGAAPAEGELVLGNNGLYRGRVKTVQRGGHPDDWFDDRSKWIAWIEEPWNELAGPKRVDWLEDELLPRATA